MFHANISAISALISPKGITIVNVLKMCTHPITITRNSVFGPKTYTVPCGKCAECVNKKRSELAALSVHQANVCGDVRFFTLTYSNAMCPVAIYDPAVDRVIGFERGVDDWIKDGQFLNRVCVDSDKHLIFTPSLRREDVKLWLKQFRQAWKRAHNENPDFKYCFFGEYGDRRGRPHFHGLVYGASSEMIDMMSNFWRSRFGFTCVVPPSSERLSTDDISAISNYVSKYIGKGIHSRFADILPYVEKPRRQSSLDFGQFSDSEIIQFARFMRDATLLSPDVLHLMNYIGSLIDARLLSIPDVPMPCHKD